MKFKTLVIGGSGFLGSHVADALSEAGHKVTIFDHKTSPYKRGDQQEIIGSILDEQALRNAIKGMDYVYHMAGIADIDECNSRPVDTVKINVFGTAHVLEACKEADVKKLVFASSAYVYSDSGSFYRVSKQACEGLIETYHEEFGLNYVILRYGSLYGPRTDRRNSLYRICEDALTQQEINYGGKGDERREFIHVFDASKMSVQVLGDNFSNQNIILTGPTTIKYSDLLSMVSEMLQNKVKINYHEKKAKTHYKLSPYSFSPKFGKKLIANPQVDLGQGLINLLGEIHQSLHPDVQEKFGLLTTDSNEDIH